MNPLEQLILDILVEVKQELCFSTIADLTDGAYRSIFDLDNALNELEAQGKVKVKREVYTRRYTLISNEVSIHEED